MNLCAPETLSAASILTLALFVATLPLALWNPKVRAHFQRTQSAPSTVWMLAACLGLLSSVIAYSLACL